VWVDAVRGYKIKPTQVKHDRVAEALPVAIAAGLQLDLLDLRVHRFAQRIGCLHHNRINRALNRPCVRSI